jgi:ribosomal protein S10
MMKINGCQSIKMKKNQFKMYKFHPKCRDTIKENWMNDIHSRVLDVNQIQDILFKAGPPESHAGI